jgi:hypothetical protein
MLIRRPEHRRRVVKIAIALPLGILAIWVLQFSRLVLVFLADQESITLTELSTSQNLPTTAISSMTVDATSAASSKKNNPTSNCSSSSVLQAKASYKQKKKNKKKEEKNHGRDDAKHRIPTSTTTTKPKAALPGMTIERETTKTDPAVPSLFPIKVAAEPAPPDNLGKSTFIIPPAKYAPLLLNETITRPVKVRILLCLHNNHLSLKFRKRQKKFLSDEGWNIVLDGLERSPYFDFQNLPQIPHAANYPIQEDNTNVVWIVDMRRMIPQEDWSIPEQVLEVAKLTRQYQQNQTWWNTTTSSSTSATSTASDGNGNSHTHHATPKISRPWIKVVFLDFRDRHCSLCGRQKAVEGLKALLGAHNVRLVQQQWQQGRHWSPINMFPTTGQLIPRGRDGPSWCLDPYPVLQIPYTVRSDYAEAVQEVYTKYLSNADTGTLADKKNHPTITPCDTIRPRDVAHFWSIQPNEPYAELRNEVTKVVLSLNNSTTTTTNATTTNQIQNHTRQRTPLQVLGDVVSANGSKGRTTAQAAYVDALLTTKIVVVAQRDAWEDHYRLFEALIGGALVMTDPMWTLPGGYVHGENIVVYQTLEELRQYLLYYLEHPEERLEIARKGWQLAKSRHRTYHWMEELFFGKRLTK